MPITEIVPYVRQPENVVPGPSQVLRDRVYARRIRLADSGREPFIPSYENRRQSAASGESLGGTDIYAQASLLDLYDPIARRTSPTWAMCGRGMHLWMLSMGDECGKEHGGRRRRIPDADGYVATLAAQIREYLGANPQAKWHVYEPINRDNVYEERSLRSAR